MFAFAAVLPASASPTGSHTVVPTLAVPEKSSRAELHHV